MDRKTITPVLSLALFVALIFFLAVALQFRDGSRQRNSPGAWNSLPFAHTKQMNILNAGYWQGGEYRVCRIEVGYNPTTLDCSDTTHRESDIRMDVVFDGSMGHAQWDCKRRRADVFCKPYEPR